MSVQGRQVMVRLAFFCSSATTCDTFLWIGDVRRRKRNSAWLVWPRSFKLKHTPSFCCEAGIKLQLRTLERTRQDGRNLVCHSFVLCTSVVGRIFTAFGQLNIVFRFAHSARQSGQSDSSPVVRSGTSTERFCNSGRHEQRTGRGQGSGVR